MKLTQKPFRITCYLLVSLLLLNLLPQEAFANPGAITENAPLTQNESTSNNAIIDDSKLGKGPIHRLGEIKEKRTRNIKFFLNSDMTTTAEVHSNSVHYPLNGRWEEIDNTIIEDMSNPEMPLRNTANDMVVRLARNFSEKNKLISVKKDNHMVSITPLSGSSATAQFTDNSSTVVYKNIYPDIDFEYNVTSDMLKENIILNKYTGKNKFSFQIHSTRLTPQLAGNNVAFIDNTGEKKFIIPAPYMCDSAHQYSDNISVSLDTQSGPFYTLTYTINKEWLQDAARQYPVVIDPAIATSRSTGSGLDAYVYSGLPNQNYGYTNLLTVGKDLGKEYRAFLKWAHLPELEAADVIVNAELILTYSTADWTYVPMYVHEIVSPWDSQTVTWNNQPDIDPIILDYSEFRYGHKIDITSLIKKWYLDGTHNGIMLNTTKSGIIKFYSLDHPWESYRPYISITYTNFSGLEDYFSYTTMDLGRSGTAFINNYNGNLIYAHSDIQLSGNRLPLQVSHTYNSNNRDENIGFGNGWRLNLSQTITTQVIGNYEYFLYTDGDGTVHYFLKRFNADPLLETPGINLKLTLEDNNYIINDSKDNKLLFDQEGYLKEIKDNQGNITAIEYRNNRITSIKDGSGRVANLIYDSEGNLIRITDPSQRQILFQYLDSTLIRVIYPNGLITNFEYNSDRLQTAKHPANQQLDIQYYTDNSVQSIANFSAEGNLGQSYSFKYDINTTQITDANGKRVLHQFNNYGNTVNIIDPELNAAHYHYENNLVMQAVPFQSTTINLLKNHDMVEARDWELINENSSATGGNYWDDGYFGYSSLQITKADPTGRSYFSQGLEVAADTYTLSGYIKTSELSGGGLGAALLIKYEDGSGNWEEISSQGVTGTQDWQRLHVTFTIPEGYKNSQVIVGLMVQGTVGSAWFDCIQLEVGLLPTSYNILENSSFELGYWNPDYLSSTEALFGSHSLLIHGNESHEDSSRSIDCRLIRRLKNNIFVVSGWAKANSVSKGNFQIIVRFKDYYGRNSVDYFIPFDKGTTDWQYTAAVIEPPFYYSYQIIVDYRYNSNTAYFDGIQMTQVGTQSFTYDSSLNLTSIRNTNKQQSYFLYNPQNDLTKVTTPTNKSYDYFYDTKHNLLSTLSPTGNSNSYWYDKHGNITSAISDQLNKDNYINNGHFSGDLYPWWQTQTNDTGTISLSSDHSIFGTESLHIKSSHTGQAGYVGAYQQATVKENQTYTISLWQKTKLPYSKATLVVEQYNSAPWPAKTDTLCFLSGEQDWKFQCVEFTTEPDVGWVRLFLQIERDDIDNLNTAVIEEAWFDGIQMELGDSPSSYNHLYNSDFRLRSGHIPKEFQFITESGYLEIYSGFTSPIENRYVKLTGLYASNQGYLDINQIVCLKPDTRYTASFWVKGTGLTNDNQVIAEAICVDASGQNPTPLFTSSIDEESFDWRRIAVSFTTPTDAYKLNNLKLGFVNPGKGELWYGNLSLKEQGTTNISYTSDGNYAHTVTDSAGQIAATYDYNLLSGDLNSITDIKGNVQSYTYDTLGRVTSITDQTSGISQSYVYHETDNLLRIHRDNFDYLFNYDAFGRRTAVSIEENGNQTALATNTYNNIGMLSNTTFGNGQIIEYTYDSNYRLDSIQNNGSSRYSYYYDAKGNIAMVVDNVNSATTWYNYDLADRLVSQRDCNGRYVVYDYDKENNVTRIKESMNGETLTTNYTYNIDNAIEKVTTSSGDVIDFRRIDNTLPLRTVLTTQNGNIIETKFTFNVENKVALLDNSLDNYHYDYDLSRNIIGISSSTYQVAYTYDSLNQLTSEILTRDGLTTTTGFSYDSHGNMISRTAGSNETGYTYHLDRLTHIEEKVDGVTVSTQALDYDGAGNLLNDGECSYTWQMGRQLAGISGADLTASYKYNENGLRTEKTVNGQTHEYTLLGSSVTREVIRDSAGNILWTIRYSYAGDSTPVSMNVNGTEYYYLKNAQGDITHIVDSDGNEVASYEYDAWGNHLSISGDDIAEINPYRYRGYRYDSETGLYYLQSRYYNPKWGRFISADPLLRTSHIIGINAYLYCDNDPVNLIDSDGNHPIQGFHHEFVVGWLAFNPASPLVGATPNVTIRGGGRSGLPGSRGYADLIHVTGVYEVKPAGERYIPQAKRQLRRYTGGDYIGTVIFSVTATNGGYNYLIDSQGDGIITYTYTPANPIRQKELDSCRTKQSIYELALYYSLDFVFSWFEKIPAGVGGWGGVPGGSGLWGLEHAFR